MHSKLEAATFAMQRSFELERTRWPAASACSMST
jgi:hypothetical protein